MIKKLIIILLTSLLLFSGCGDDEDGSGDDTGSLNDSGSSELLQLTPDVTGFSAYGRTQFSITSKSSCSCSFDLMSEDKTRWFGTMYHSGFKSLFVFNLPEGQYIIETENSGACDWLIEISNFGVDDSIPYRTGQDPADKPDDNFSSSPGGSPVVDNSGNNDTDSDDNTDSDDSGSCGSDRFDCSDFTSCADVMAVFNSCSYDVHGLDGDGNGTPCEDLCSGYYNTQDESTGTNEDDSYSGDDNTSEEVNNEASEEEYNEASEEDTVITETDDTSEPVIETAGGYTAQAGHNESKSYSDDLEEQ